VLMRCRTLTQVMIVLALANAAAFAAGPPAALQAIAQRYEAADYRGALREIAKVMGSNDVGPADSDLRYELLRYKGESLLRLKEKSYAADAFDDASRVSVDRSKVAAARATALLVRAARGTVYVAHAGADGIDILEPDSRRRAMLALAESEFTRLQPLVERATSGSTLPPIRDLLEPIADAYALELTATGSDARSRPLLDKLGSHARELIRKELTRLSLGVERLNAVANELIIDESPFGDEIRRRGLDTQQRRELGEVGEYLVQIARAARTGRRVAITFDGPRQEWESIVAEADAIADRAAEVRDRRY
jgi:hypothetical protein